MNIHLISQRLLNFVSLSKELNLADSFSHRSITQNGKACPNPIGCKRNDLPRLKRMLEILFQWLKKVNRLRNPFPLNILGQRTADSLRCGKTKKVWIGFTSTTILRTLDLKNGRLKLLNVNLKKIVTKG